MNPAVRDARGHPALARRTREAEPTRQWCLARGQVRLYKVTQVLAQADRSWLAGLVTRCEPPAAFQRALNRQPDDIKVVVQFADA